MKKNPPLPSSDEVKNCTDIAWLEETSTWIDEAAIAIQTQLEVYEDDGSGWEGRAVAALTAHKIALKGIDRQLYRIGTRGRTPQHVTDEARRIENERKKEENRANQLAANAQASTAKKDKLKLVVAEFADRTHLVHSLQIAMSEICSNDLNAQIWQRAWELHNERMAGSIKRIAA